MENYRIISSLDELIDFCTMFDSERFAYDTETTSLSYFDMDLVGISIYDGKNFPTYFQFNFNSTYTVKEQDPNNPRRKIDSVRHYKHKSAIDFDAAYPYIKKLFTGKRVVCHNAKFDYKVATKFGFNDFILDGDTMLMAYLFDVNMPHGLKPCAVEFLGLKMPDIATVLGMKPDNVRWPEVNFKAFGEYACRDAYVTLKLEEVFTPMLEDLKLTDTYKKLELPAVIPVAKMEMAGVLIDKDVMAEIAGRLEADLERNRQQIFSMCGVEFNINSNDQLGEILFKRLGYPVKTYTKTGKPQVTETTLKELAYDGYPVAEVISDYKEEEKLLNTYARKIPLMCDPDGRLRCSLNQTGARTGRFSSSEPNLQNQPNNKKYPIRRAYVPTPGYSFINADWSTIEIRVMAHVSGDPVLSDILNNGRDIHQETADLISKITGLKLTRSQGKTLNFAILYGMSPESLAYKLNLELKDKVTQGKMTQAEYESHKLSLPDAKKIVAGFYKAYAGFTEWGEREVRRTVSRGYVRTIGNRIRRVPELKNNRTFSFGKRIVINTAIQGGAGDLMKLALPKLDALFDEKYDGRLLLTVHDEYLVECRKDQAKECLKDVIYIMQNIFPTCTVPIKAEGEITDDWAELKMGKKKKKDSTALRLLKYKLLKLK